MAVAGLRAPWLVTLLVALLALPIVAITVYFAVGVGHLIAIAETERAGLSKLQTLQSFFADASAYAQSAQCPGETGGVAATRVRADAALPAVNDRPVNAAWRTARQSATPANLNALFDALNAAFVKVSDASQLTFDPAVAGIDLSDSLAYRIPRALDQLQRARRKLCVMTAAPSMGERIALVQNQTRAEQALYDNADDVRDAIDRGNSQRFSDLQTQLQRSQSAATEASQNLEAFATARGPQDRKATIFALDGAIASLYELAGAEPPVLYHMLDSRLNDYAKQRIVTFVPGLIGIFAALLVALLTLRLLWESAARAAAAQAAAEHERVAMHDGLTGLLNRRAFLGIVQRAIEGPHHGALCMFDVDDFKKVNDTYGHLAGDDVLITLSRIIEGSVRSTDAVARLGGDEFAIFLHSPIDRRGVERVLSKIAEEAADAMTIRGNTINATLSAGAAMIDEDRVPIEEALGAADSALYRAKASARGSFLFSEIAPSAR